MGLYKRVSIIDLALSLSKSLDLVSPVLVGHHMRVSYIALQIAIKLNLDRNSINNLIIASLLHDVGSLSLEERMDTLQFDVLNPNHHAQIGYHLLSKHKRFERIGEIIRYHHFRWNERDIYEDDIPIESYILHLSDRVDILTDKKLDLFQQRDKIISKIIEQKGRIFNPIIVDAFLEAWDEVFNYIDIDRNYIQLLFGRYTDNTLLNLDELVEVTNIFENVIDFRSRFTSTHSSGVSRVAVKISDLMGFNEVEKKEMKIAGHLHDIGKLGVPEYILEKPGRLTYEEMVVMKRHGLYTYIVLNEINGLDNITQWAAFHHEKLNGKGYPMKLTGDGLDLGSRIMAVADIFTAITEDRPYRMGMEKNEVQRILGLMVKNNEIDEDVVSVLMNNYDEIDAIRREEQAKAAMEFQDFCKRAACVRVK